MKILILCTGNSCRSQMAEGIMKSIDSNLELFSAGTKPAEKVSSKAIHVMNEIGIDLSSNYPKLIDEFLNQEFDFVITVCDNAKEACPIFNGEVKNRLHIGFDDPNDAIGSDDYVLSEFRRIRDEIKNKFDEFYNQNIKNKLKEIQ